MELDELAREWRIWVLILSLIGATLMLGPSYGTNDDGKVVINTNLEGRLGVDFTGGTRLLVAMNTSEFEENISEDPQEDTSKGLRSSIRYILPVLDLSTGQDNKQNIGQSERIANQVRDVIQIRVERAGLPDPSVRSVRLGPGNYRVQVEVAGNQSQEGNNQSRVEEVIKKPGKFEARMPIRVTNSREFTLDETYTLKRNNGSLLVEETGNSYELGERFELDGSEFVFVNQSEDSARVEVVTYTGAEISDVLLGDQSAGVDPNGPPYGWRFPIVITSDAAQDLNNIANNYEVSVGDEGWLIHENGDYARMTLYVDGDEQSSLRMSSVFQERSLTQSQISGGEQTREVARKSMLDMAAILQSGELPVPVYIDSKSFLSAALGNEYLRASILSIIGSLIAVGFIVTARYQNPKVALPIVFTGATEVYILLGFWFTTIGSLTLSAMAGIIAAVGTGVDDQIIITDESDREVITSWTEKMKRAFFVIFTSAASTIGAMLPIVYPSLISMMIAAAGLGLLFYNYYSRGTSSHFTAIGIFASIVGITIFINEPSGQAMSTIHDFAWTTIIGIMVGITITRPAFAKVIEQIEE